MDNKFKSVLKEFEQIKENHLGQLTGGFTTLGQQGSPQSALLATNNCRKVCSGTSNNCLGGNCFVGCPVNRS